MSHPMDWDINGLFEWIEENLQMLKIWFFKDSMPISTYQQLLTEYELARL